MKTILFFLLILASCITVQPSPSYVNRWCGTVLIVNVEYEFNKNGTYIENTFASNGVQVGGTKGIWKAKDDAIISMKQTQEYEFDNATLTGRWYNREKEYDIMIKVLQNTIYIDVDKNNDFAMFLQKCGTTL